MSHAVAGLALWQPRASAPILAAMRFFRFISPMLAASDLYQFLRKRRRHEVAFFILAASLTWGMFLLFLIDTRIDHPYKRDIVYVEQWRADRSDAEIAARLKKDAPREAAERAEIEREEAERRASFARLNNQLDSWGL